MLHIACGTNSTGTPAAIRGQGAFVKFQRIAVTAAITAVAVSVAGCGHHGAAGGNSGYADAIATYANAHACIDVQVGRTFGLTGFPIKGSAFTGEAEAELSALTHAGLLTVTRGAETAYSLTGAGKAAQNPHDPFEFCAGKYRVVKVGEGSPVDVGGGASVMKLPFTYGATDVQAWAHDPAVGRVYPSLAGRLTGTQEGSAMMQKQGGGGWIVGGVHLQDGRDL